MRLFVLCLRDFGGRTCGGGGGSFGGGHFFFVGLDSAVVSLQEHGFFHPFLYKIEKKRERREDIRKSVSAWRHDILQGTKKKFMEYHVWKPSSGAVLVNLTLIADNHWLILEIIC
jgi:hypothetical protein